MDLNELLPLSHILFLNPDSVHRDNILPILAEPFRADSMLESLEAYVADVENREADMSTQMRGGIALPHASSAAVRRLGLVVGIVKEPGIEYDPDCEENVTLFFLMAVPATSPAAHLPLLGTLAKFLADETRVAALRSATTPEQVQAMLLSECQSQGQ
ncbi:MAG: PTS sugar transporter subunit IIA [Victivallales bacterium]|nr:PTS sugar transporter subunit IIA [Victivallales bacterium]